MHYSYGFLLLLASSALANNYSNIVRCGTEDPPTALLETAKSMVNEEAKVAAQSIEIDTYFHLVTTEAKEGLVTDQMLADQVCCELQLAHHPGLFPIFCLLKASSAKHN